MGFEPGLFSGRLCDLPGCAASADPSMSSCPVGETTITRAAKDRPPASDLFGVKGRRWLSEQQLVLCECDRRQIARGRVPSDV